MAAGFVEINGYRMRVADEGGGAAVVLIHGTPLDLTFWDALVAALQDRRIVRYDVRGHGSARGVLVPELDVLAADVVALLDRLDLRACHFSRVSHG
jgi:pimeloyl-ACP methyl ester carboxylesterase